MTIEQCKLIQLPKIEDVRGNLSVIESNKEIPFDIQRVYYLYDVPGGSMRGGHAHKKLHQLIVAIGGSFDVAIDDGHNKKIYHLNRSHIGLYICPMIWRVINNFSSGSLCLVMASELFDEADYIRDYNEFVDNII
jgi:dTDP-4-dehydrorhamnose 3,5-epimerase-like enzyme